MSACFAITILAKNPSLFKLPKGTRVLVLMRCIVGLTSFLLLVGALKFLSFSTAMVLYFLYPMFTSIAACIFLKEKLTVYDILAILFSLLGVAVFAFP